VLRVLARRKGPVDAEEAAGGIKKKTPGLMGERGGNRETAFVRLRKELKRGLTERRRLWKEELNVTTAQAEHVGY